MEVAVAMSVSFAAQLRRVREDFKELEVSAHFSSRKL
jgi:hypothetical protein